MQVKRTLCMNDMQQVRIRLLEEERDEAERLLSTVTAQLKQARVRYAYMQLYHKNYAT